MTSQDFQYLAPYGVQQPGTAMQIPARNALDADLMGAHGGIGVGAVPGAQYPDGYLGSIQSRREGRLRVGAVRNALTDRSYQRGVHKGDKINPQDYFWPKGFEDDRRLKAMARATREEDGRYLVPRATPRGTLAEMVLADGGRIIGPNGIMMPVLPGATVMPPWSP